MEDGEFTKEGIQEIRKGIARGEPVTPVQEEMLALDRQEKGRR